MRDAPLGELKHPDATQDHLTSIQVLPDVLLKLGHVARLPARPWPVGEGEHCHAMPETPFFTTPINQFGRQRDSAAQSGNAFFSSVSSDSRCTCFSTSDKPRTRGATRSRRTLRASNRVRLYAKCDVIARFSGEHRNPD